MKRGSALNSSFLPLWDRFYYSGRVQTCIYLMGHLYSSGWYLRTQQETSIKKTMQKWKLLWHLSIQSLCRLIFTDCLNRILRLLEATSKGITQKKVRLHCTKKEVMQIYLYFKPELMAYQTSTMLWTQSNKSPLSVNVWSPLSTSESIGAFRNVHNHTGFE